LPLVLRAKHVNVGIGLLAGWTAVAAGSVSHMNWLAICASDLALMLLIVGIGQVEVAVISDARLPAASMRKLLLQRVCRSSLFRG
jgi:hypothetical protein